MKRWILSLPLAMILRMVRWAEDDKKLAGTVAFLVLAGVYFACCFSFWTNVALWIFIWISLRSDGKGNHRTGDTPAGNQCFRMAATKKFEPLRNKIMAGR